MLFISSFVYFAAEPLQATPHAAVLKAGLLNCFMSSFILNRGSILYCRRETIDNLAQKHEYWP